MWTRGGGPLTVTPPRAKKDRIVAKERLTNVRLNVTMAMKHN
jgi:hypothetical protein